MPIDVLPRERERFGRDAQRAVPRERDEEPHLRVAAYREHLVHRLTRHKDHPVRVALAASLHLGERVLGDHLPAHGQLEERPRGLHPLAHRRGRQPLVNELLPPAFGVERPDRSECAARPESVLQAAARLLVRGPGGVFDVQAAEDLVQQAPDGCVRAIPGRHQTDPGKAAVEHIGLVAQPG
ncbi:MAG TPA: hypothetical protein VD971_08280 [Phycisphaerales bacterium]|nr:hypothetical protein [Phycisphaerales bacterium]